MKHTPGPWRVCSQKHDGRFVIDSPSQVIAITAGVFIYDAEANARLIAKAPEMFELLKEYWMDQKCQALIQEIEGDT